MEAGAADDVSEYTDDESDIAEELGYISPLDTVDPYVSFKQALTSKQNLIKWPFPGLTHEDADFQMKDGNNYQRATTSLSQEEQMLLMEIMRIAEEHSQSA